MEASSGFRLQKSACFVHFDIVSLPCLSCCLHKQTVRNSRIAEFFTSKVEKWWNFSGVRLTYGWKITEFLEGKIPNFTSKSVKSQWFFVEATRFNKEALSHQQYCWGDSVVLNSIFESVVSYGFSTIHCQWKWVYDQWKFRVNSENLLYPGDGWQLCLGYLYDCMCCDYRDAFVTEKSDIKTWQFQTERDSFAEKRDGLGKTRHNLKLFWLKHVHNMQMTSSTFVLKGLYFWLHTLHVTGIQEFTAKLWLLFFGSFAYV